jgi:ubiquinone/menaquinone biosynthesis C-methylase UbiE
MLPRLLTAAQGTDQEIVMRETVYTEFVQTEQDDAGGQVDEPPVVPNYLRDVYGWAYLNPRSVRLFEHQWIVNLILWGNYARLRDAALNELGSTITGRTLQVACVYGDFTPRLIERLAGNARLDVVDVAPIQLDNLGRKLGQHGNVFLDHQDASRLTHDAQTFDQIVVFFLLHELPDEVRAMAVAEVLRVVKPGGRVVFVDYHRPVGLHPHRYLMRPVLRLLEPFALDLWNQEIAAWIPAHNRPRRVHKSRYFGGLYQKVVMIR